LISSGSDCSGTGGSVQTASVSPAQTFETYNVTIAQEECERNTESGEFGYFAVVDSDGFNLLDSPEVDLQAMENCIQSGVARGVCDVGVIMGPGQREGYRGGVAPVRCEDLSQWQKGVQGSPGILGEGSAQVVFVGAPGPKSGYGLEQWLNKLGVGRYGDWKYNFETDLWVATQDWKGRYDKGDSFKNGVRVE